MSRVRITKEVQFDAGHRVPRHASKCRNPHGHRYRVVAEVSGPLQEEGAATGMVLDFGDLKDILMEVHDRFDHGFIVWDGDEELEPFMAETESKFGWKIIFVPYHPTAENLAQDITMMVRARLPFGQGLMLESITVWETPTSSATWR